MSTGLKTGVFTLVLLAVAGAVSAPSIAESDFEKIEIWLPLGVIIINSNSLLQASPLATPESATKFLVHLTAYSSSEDETDSTPYLTASGTRVRDGVVASNLFSFGTRIKIPRVFGDKVFVVEDRMHERFNDRIDIWMPSKWQAWSFGKKTTEVEVVEL